MTDLRKAAEMVIEAHDEGYGKIAHDLSIQALRQALAQPVDAVNMSQERVDETAKREHEPYGYVWTSLRDGMEVRFSRMPPNKFYNPQDIKPVYTAPPKREWVGLTDDEMFNALLSIDAEIKRLPTGLKQFAKAIEAKLKEKNS